MRKSMFMAMMALLLIAFTISGCGRNDMGSPADHSQHTQSNPPNDFADSIINPTSELTALTDHLSAVQFEGDDFFEIFLESGGANCTRDEEVTVTDIKCGELYLFSGGQLRLYFKDVPGANITVTPVGAFADASCSAGGSQKRL